MSRLPLHFAQNAWHMLLEHPLGAQFVHKVHLPQGGEVAPILAHLSGLSVAKDAHFFWHQQDHWHLSLGDAQRVPWGKPPAPLCFLDPEVSKSLRLSAGQAFYPEGWQEASLWQAWPTQTSWLGAYQFHVTQDDVCGLAVFDVDRGAGFEAFKSSLHKHHDALVRMWTEAQRGEPQLQKVQLSAQRDVQSKQFWQDLVRTATSQLSYPHTLVDKLVLARAISLEHSACALPLGAMVHDLLPKFGSSCTLFALKPPEVAAHDVSFVGATPECLVKLDPEGRLLVDALAGSAAPEVPDEVLLGSQKDRQEHQFVIDAITEALSDVTTLHVPKDPVVDRLSNVSHLRTPITGVLEDQEVGLLDLVARLHPTPAVCGRPRTLAMHWLAQHEKLERGWYTGVVGWQDLQGAGEFDVALRCGLLQRESATLFVGAGIVAASEPESEWEETKVKARAVGSFWEEGVIDG